MAESTDRLDAIEGEVEETFARAERQEVSVGSEVAMRLGLLLLLVRGARWIGSTVGRLVKSGRSR